MHHPPAEITLSAAVLENLIDEQFPELAPSRAELLGAGWDNWAYLVNNKYVFRCPRRQIAVAFLRNELRLLPLIAARVPLAVPVPVYSGRETSRYPWPVAGYILLPGRTACAAALDDRQRRDAAGLLADFLRALHGIPAELALEDGAIGDELGRLDIRRRGSQARERVDALAALGLVADLQPLLEIIHHAENLNYHARTDQLVHGDLYSRHLLVDRDNRLTGIIDWGDVHLGDAAEDLAVAFIFLPPQARREFRDAYGEIDSRVWGMARFRALCHTLAVLPFAHEIADAGLIAESALALKHIAEEPL